MIPILRRADGLLLLAAMACAPAEGDDQVGRGAPAAFQAVPVRTYGKHRPIDEGAANPEFSAFRARLMAIIARRDTAALLAIVSPEVRVSLGPDDGIQGFHQRWLRGGEAADLWTTLGDLLRHGGRFQAPDLFVAPYTAGGLPDSVSGLEVLVVRDSGVVVRATPDSNAAVLGTLSFDVVRAAPESATPGWSAIAIDSGRVGYVRADLVRSPLDHRVGFRREEGGWRLVLLLAGD